MQPVIQLKEVTKLYGSSVGVKDVSLDVAPGVIFGFLGPNGAGKTTTISMLVDLIRPTGGQINIFGLDSTIDSLAIRQRIGFLAGDFALDSDLTGWQQLEYFGNLRGSFDKQYVQELAQRLDCDLHKKFKNLSRGTRQKVGLISALMHRPELLIFDEPTSGLDPLVQAEFHHIIDEHRKAGKSAFISSHVLSEVQEICDQVAFIRSGSVVAVKTLQELATSSAKHVRVISEDKKLLASLNKLPSISDQSKTTSSVSFTINGDINPLLKLLSQYHIKDVTITEMDLEAVFMHYYQEKTDV